MARVAILGNSRYASCKLLYDILDLYSHDDNDLTIVTGGAYNLSQWAAEWAMDRDVNWSTQLENWNKFDDDSWLMCHVGLIKCADSGLLFWDGKSERAPILMDMAKQFEIPLTVIVCDNEENDFEVL